MVLAEIRAAYRLTDELGIRIAIMSCVTKSLAGNFGNVLRRAGATRVDAEDFWGILTRTYWEGYEKLGRDVWRGPLN